MSAGIVLRNAMLLLATSAVMGPDAASPLLAQTGERVGLGGIGRGAAGRWTMTRGVFSNPTDDEAAWLIVVTPAGSGGEQYARRMVVPPRASRETQWPIRLADPFGLVDIEYLVFPGGVEDTVIRRRPGESAVPSFPCRVTPDGLRHAGWVTSGLEDRDEKHYAQMLLRAILRKGQRASAIAPVAMDECTSPLALDSLEILLVTSSRLTERPDFCEAVRLWVQRGGRLLVLVDMCGLDVARALLGDALPVTMVGETSLNDVTLDLNPDYSTRRFPVRQIVREFEEPARLLRVHAESGETIWSVEGWPAAVRIPYGKGHVLSTFVSPRAFLESVPGKSGEEAYTFIGSSDRFTETLLHRPAAPLVDRELVANHASGHIGYEIPSRLVAAALMVGFPLAVLLCGLWWQRRQRGEWLLVGIPVMAILMGLPALFAGRASRAVAPQTVVQHQLVRAVPGESLLARDGIATVYNPEPVTLQVSTTKNSLFQPDTPTADQSYRRLLWTGSGTAQWENLDQLAGIRTAQVRSTLETSSALRATATFDQSGLTGRLDSGPLRDPQDVVLLAPAAVRQGVRLEPDGQFTSGTGDVLAPGQFLRGTLLSEEQLHHAEVYAALQERSGAETFPAVPSLLYWARQKSDEIQAGTKSTRTHSQLLVVQPIELQPPQPSVPFTIPPVLLPYRSVADANGTFGTAYNNARRTWTEKRRAGRTTLEFRLPDACLPFVPSAANLTVRLRAGERNVDISAGPLEAPVLIRKLESPVGTFDVQLPPEGIRQTCLTGRIFIQITVGELLRAREEGVGENDQEDPWMIDHLSLVLSGTRNAR